MVWAGISLGAQTGQHVFHGGTLTSVRYRDEIRDPYVQPYAGAIGQSFILTDDNEQSHLSAVVEDYREGHGFRANGKASSVSTPETDRTSLGQS